MRFIWPFSGFYSLQIAHYSKPLVLRGRTDPCLKFVITAPIQTDMHLRDHPKMWLRQSRSWPPIWTPFGGFWDKHGQILQGEIGVLRKVRYHPGKIYLTIRHEGKKYVGCILLDDEVFCVTLAEHLQRLRGKLIDAIGSSEIATPLERR